MCSGDPPNCSMAPGLPFTQTQRSYRCQAGQSSLALSVWGWLAGSESSGKAPPGLASRARLVFLLPPAQIRTSHIHGVQSSLRLFLKTLFPVMVDFPRDVELELNLASESRSVCCCLSHPW